MGGGGLRYAADCYVGGCVLNLKRLGNFGAELEDARENADSVRVGDEEIHVFFSGRWWK